MLSKTDVKTLEIMFLTLRLELKERFDNIDNQFEDHRKRIMSLQDTVIGINKVIEEDIKVHLYSIDKTLEKHTRILNKHEETLNQLEHRLESIENKLI